jgi:hypothetical protein
MEFNETEVDGIPLNSMEFRENSWNFMEFGFDRDADEMTLLQRFQNTCTFYLKQRAL